MNIEEKAKRYDEAIERAKLELNSPDKRLIEYIFPELKESEDEKIRKAIYNCVKWFGFDSCFFKDVSQEECLTWLEKQGEHAKFRDSIQIGDKVTRNEDVVLVNLSQLKRVAKPADKVEPKFHEGDIIIHKELGGDYIHNPHKIIQVDILDKKYLLEGGLVAHFGEQEDYELVEQKPAENKGMNLVEEDMTPFQKKVFRIIDTTIEEEQGLKQVCDELLRLAHDESMQKLAWSEEDERMLDSIIKEFEAIKFNEKTIFEKNIIDDKISFLKSLRPQSKWKPTEEQMYLLNWVTICLGDGLVAEKVRQVLESLYNDLKAL